MALSDGTGSSSVEEIFERLRAAIREEFAKVRIAMDKQFARTPRWRQQLGARRVAFKRHRNRGGSHGCCSVDPDAASAGPVAACAVPPPPTTRAGMVIIEQESIAGKAVADTVVDASTASRELEVTTKRVSTPPSSGIFRVGDGHQMPEAHEEDSQVRALNCFEAPIDVDIKGEGRTGTLTTEEILVAELGAQIHFVADHLVRTGSVPGVVPFGAEHTLALVCKVFDEVPSTTVKYNVLESAFMGVVGPVRDCFHHVLLDVLALVDRKVDDTVHELAKHLLQMLRTVSTCACAVSSVKGTTRAALAKAEPMARYVYGHGKLLASGLYVRYELAAEHLAVPTWRCRGHLVRAPPLPMKEQRHLTMFDEIPPSCDGALSLLGADWLKIDVALTTNVNSSCGGATAEFMIFEGVFKNIQAPMQTSKPCSSKGMLHICGAFYNNVDIVVRPAPWPNFVISSTILVVEFMNSVLLSEETSSQCLTNGLKLLGSSMIWYGRWLWDPGISFYQGCILLGVTTKVAEHKLVQVLPVFLVLDAMLGWQHGLAMVMAVAVDYYLFGQSEVLMVVLDVAHGSGNLQYSAGQQVNELVRDQANHRVLEFWTNCNDSLGTNCDSQFEFVKRFKAAAQVLKNLGNQAARCILVVLVCGFMRYVLLSKATSSKCWNISLELLPSSDPGHVICSAYLLDFPQESSRNMHQLYFSGIVCVEASVYYVIHILGELSSRATQVYIQHSNRDLVVLFLCVTRLSEHLIVSFKEVVELTSWPACSLCSMHNWIQVQWSIANLLVDSLAFLNRVNSIMMFWISDFVGICSAAWLNDVLCLLSVKQVYMEPRPPPPTLEIRKINEFGLDWSSKGTAVIFGADQIYKMIQMLDFNERLPKSQGCRVILSSLFTAVEVAHTFFSELVKWYGIPHPMVFDRGKVFTSNLWQEFLKLIGTELQLGSVYYLQSEGQTEYYSFKILYGLEPNSNAFHAPISRSDEAAQDTVRDKEHTHYAAENSVQIGALHLFAVTSVVARLCFLTTVLHEFVSAFVDSRAAVFVKISVKLLLFVSRLYSIYGAMVNLTSRIVHLGGLLCAEGALSYCTSLGTDRFLRGRYCHGWEIDREMTTRGNVDWAGKLDWAGVCCVVSPRWRMGTRINGLRPVHAKLSNE